MTATVTRGSQDGVPASPDDLRRRQWNFDLTVRWGSAKIQLSSYQEEIRESKHHIWQAGARYSRLSPRLSTTIPPLPADVVQEAQSKLADQVRQIKVER